MYKRADGPRLKIVHEAKLFKLDNQCVLISDVQTEFSRLNCLCYLCVPVSIHALPRFNMILAMHEVVEFAIVSQLGVL